MDRRTIKAALYLGLSLLIAGAGQGCAAPQGGVSATHTVRLYVSNGRDGTISQLDAQSGRPLGPPLPGGPTPAWIVAGEGGRLLILPAGAGLQGTLTHVAPVAGDWQARKVPLELGAQPALLTGDGHRYAMVGYSVAHPRRRGARPQTESCRLALIDLHAGAVVRTHRVCAPGDTMTGLALASDATGTVAYVALWRPERLAGGRWQGAAGRLLAVDGFSGEVLESLSVSGLPGAVLLGPAPGRSGRRVYVVVAAPGASAAPSDDYQRQTILADGWQLLGLQLTTLDLASEQPIPFLPSHLVVAPDGEYAYAFVGGGGLSPRSTLMELNLLTGASRRLGHVPGPGSGGLAVTERRLYVPNPDGREVWVGDRRGRTLATIGVGRHPLGIAMAEHWPLTPGH
ncbi:MAG TPA: hypothetical protein VHS99_27910 [Chloroflexota bacterium]|nr:hypothetical protein [Chloroflexota bacterium]